MKAFIKKLSLLLAVGAMAFGSNLLNNEAKVAKAATYEKLTSVSQIDSSAKYVLGINGTGFHYSGTSSWGKVSASETPYYYTLTVVNASANTFNAYATINNVKQYLTVPASNAFTMSTTATTLKLGTAQKDSASVCHATTAERHIRLNGSSGLRSYANATGTIAYFYKVVEEQNKTLSSISVTSPTKTTYTVGEALDLTGMVVTAVYNTGSEIISSGYTTNPADGSILSTEGTQTVKVTYEGKTATFDVIVNPVQSGGGSESTASYVKVTSALADYSGKYLIVYETTSMAFNGSLTKLDAGKNGANVSISDNKIVYNSTTDSYSFTIEKSGENYTIKSSSGYYIGSASNKNELLSSQSTKYTNTITLENDGSVKILGSSGTTTLRYNDTAGDNNLRFRYYKSGQQAIHLYKYTEASGGDEQERTITGLSGSNIKTAFKNTETFSLGDEASLFLTYSDNTTSIINKDTEGVVYKIGDKEIKIGDPMLLEYDNQTLVISYLDQTYSLKITVEEVKVLEPGKFVKVTSEPISWEGTYVIVYEDEDNVARIFNGIEGNNAYYQDTYLDNLIIKSSNQNSEFVVKIEAMDGGYSIQSNNGYIYGEEGENLISFNETTPQLNEISLSNNEVLITSNTSVLRFNNTSGQMRFRYYKSTGYESQKSVQLYKYYTNDEYYSQLKFDLLALNTCTSATDSTTINDEASIADFNSKLNNIKTRLKYITAEQLDDFNNTLVDEIGSYTLNDRLEFLERKALTLVAPKGISSNLLSNITSSNNILIILVVGLLGLTSILGYYFLNKKKYAK